MPNCTRCGGNICDGCFLNPKNKKVNEEDRKQICPSCDANICDRCLWGDKKRTV